MTDPSSEEGVEESLASPRAADVLARRLAEAGCRRAFGIPGGEVLTLIDALEAAGIRFVLTKHENAAGFFAEGGFHRDGAPGVLVATLGPGVANAVNVVANAWQDQVPLLFLTGAVDGAHAATYTHQVFDHQQLLRPITKASFRVEAGAVDAIVDRAVAVALDDRPGPVHLDLPLAVARAPEPAAARGAYRRPRPAPVAPAPSPTLEAARALVRDARRPIVLAGIDVLHHGAAAAVRAFVESRQAPLVTTYKAKGVLPEADHPLALGGAGLSPKADEILHPLLRDADLIVAVGYDPIEMRAGWRDPWPAGAPVVELAAVPPVHQMHGMRHLLVGDVGLGLGALGAGLPAPSPAPWPEGQVPRVRAALRDAFAPESAWGPGVVFEACRAALPPETIATADSGAHRILLSQMWPCPTPRTLLQSTALCTMGCAVPLAAGAMLADPGRPAVAFVGDAGLEMVLGELATIRDLGLPVIVVVLADRSLALIERKQRASGYANAGVDFEATDFAAVAEAMGGVGRTVADRETLRRELTAALARRDRFTVLSCQLPRRAYDESF